MRKVFVRSAYNYSAEAVSRETSLVCEPDDTRVDRSAAAECDINTIVKRFGLTQVLPETFRAPLVGDFTDVVDFQTAMQAVTAAQQSFMQMPADLRSRFGHDPQKLIQFLDNDKNRDEAVKLGLVKPAPERTRDVVKAVDELAARLVPRETK